MVKFITETIGEETLIADNYKTVDVLLTIAVKQTILICKIDKYAAIKRKLKELCNSYVN